MGVGHEAVDGNGATVHRRGDRESLAKYRVDLVVRETALASVLLGGIGDAFLPVVIGVRKSVRAFANRAHDGI